MNKIMAMVLFGLSAHAQSGDYAADKFFVGTGRATGGNETEAKSKAADVARSELAKSISSKIEAVTESTTEAAREKTATGVLRETIQKSYSSRLKVGAAINGLTDVEIRDQKFNPADRTAEVSAVIDRAKYVQKHVPDLKEQGDGIRGAVNQADRASKSLKKVALLKKALSLYDQSRAQIEMYRAVRRAGDPTVVDIVGIERAQLMEKLSLAAAKIRFSVQSEGDKEVIGAATSTLGRFGFQMASGDATILRLNAEVERIPDHLMESQGMYFVRARLLVNAEEDGQQVVSFEIEANESSQDERAAKLRAVTALKRTVDESLVAKLLEAL